MSDRATWRLGLLAAHVWLLATLMPLLVRLVPLRRLAAWLTPPPLRRPYAGIDAERIRLLVERRLTRPVHMRRRACLRKGLTLFHFLRLAGHPAVMRFCVLPPSTDPNRLHAHLWVTLDGRAVCDPPQTDHAVMWVHPAEPPA